MGFEDPDPQQLSCLVGVCFMKASSFIAVSGLILFGLWLSGCGEGSKSSNSAAVAAGACTAGQVYISQYGGCYANAQCASMGANYGYVNGVGCVPGVAGNGTGYGGYYGSSSHYYSGTVSLAADRDPFRDMIHAMNFCDLGIWNLADQNCDNWDDRARIDLMVTPGALPVSASLNFRFISSFSGASMDYPVYGTLYSTGTDSGSVNTGVEFRGFVSTLNISVRSSQPIVSGSTMNPQLFTTIKVDNRTIGTSLLYLRW